MELCNIVGLRLAYGTQDLVLGERRYQPMCGVQFLIFIKNKLAVSW